MTTRSHGGCMAVRPVSEVRPGECISIAGEASCKGAQWYRSVTEDGAAPGLLACNSMAAGSCH